ncbi:MAG TPA: DNA repair protein RecN [Thermodesulfobacteriota bacterium]|nr:DNA repair protein RecN [Thermodesulfobacteriota bacterium]
MLEQLQIANLALIDRLSLAFSNQLNILSGETGAGKSMIIKAVNLLLGERSPAEIVRKGEGEGWVEALFTVPERHPIRDLMESLGLSNEEQILIKRTFQTNGKSRAWINGSLTSQSILSRVTRLLIGVSNQHEHQSLLNPAHHLDLLDHFGGLNSLKEEVRNIYASLEGSTQAWQKLVKSEEERKAQEDLWLFQIQEIRQAELIPGEDQALLHKKKVLQQSEKIYEKLYQSRQLLFEEEQSCLNTLSRAKDSIRLVAPIDLPLEKFLKELETLQWQLMEIHSGLGDYLAQLVFEPQALEQVDNRLERIKRLTAKYGSTTEEVLNYLSKVEEKVRQGEDQAERRRELEEEIVIKRKDLFEISKHLSEKRREAASVLSERVEAELKDLGMAQSRFQVNFTSLPNDGEVCGHYLYDEFILSPTGLEKGEFYLAPNVGEGLRPLARIASGGELSRILLVLKGLLSDQDSLETLVFDEVDSGIGGGLGQVLGKKLQQVAQAHQVLCITHLPQIAAFAQTHFQVSKETRKGRTHTNIRLLNEEERIEELSRMLGGSAPSAKTQSVAKEMLQQARNHPND